MPIPLRHSNVLLTGGSQGLGPYIGRLLAQAGANLALAARLVDKLQAVAEELSTFGVRVVPIGADITREADRANLLSIAENALGPVDILINNAGVENGGRFVYRSADEIERVIATNVIAPLLLTHQILPRMLERGCGHIVTISSLAGKAGRPYAAVYGASKAAVLTWSAALRVELDGTGVSVSTVTPGFVSDVGMFASHQAHAPWIVGGESKPEDVAQGVLRALPRDLPDVIVNPTPFWPIGILYAAAPRLVIKFLKLQGYFDWERRLQEGQ